MRKTVIDVTCDVCGKNSQFDARENKKWNHEVWVKVTTDDDTTHFCRFEMDICDECMDRQTALEGRARGTFSLDSVHDVKFRDGR